MCICSTYGLRSLPCLIEGPPRIRSGVCGKLVQLYTNTQSLRYAQLFPRSTYICIYIYTHTPKYIGLNDKIIFSRLCFLFRKRFFWLLSKMYFCQLCRSSLVVSVCGLPYAYIYIYIYIHIYIYMYRQIYAYLYAYISLYTYIYIHMHIWAEKLTARVRGKATVVWKSLW